MIKIIFLADIIGKIGRKAVADYLPQLKQTYQPDLVIANGENIAHGIGFTQPTLDEVRHAGVDIFTSGNHAWGKAGSDEILNNPDGMVIRPANYGHDKSGVGVKEIKVGLNYVLVINLIGRVFIDPELPSPFTVFDEILTQHNPKSDKVVFVDFHGEASSEKAAFANYADGRATVVVGTHTHVPTADERILPRGTGFITDVGMIGYYDSVIGADKRHIIGLFTTGEKNGGRHDVPDTGLCQFNALICEIDEHSQKTITIERISTQLTIS